MRYLFLFLFVITLICNAAIYIQKDKSGNVIYSDTPLSNSARQIDLPSTNRTAVPPPTPVSQSVASTASPQKGSKKPYTMFTISSPKDQDTIQNEPVIQVSIAVHPDLQSGDKIQLYLDKMPYGKPLESTFFQLNHIDRGVHDIYATLIDSNEQILMQTSSVTLYVHYAHV